MAIFNKVALMRPKRNKFNLSHEKKLSLKMGKLTPFFLSEVVPGDTFRVDTGMLARMAPMLAPIMHRVNIKTEFFFVPNRLLVDEWENFITGGPDGTLSPVMPYATMAQLDNAGYLGVRKLADYMGLPAPTNSVALATPVRVSMLPFRAYQLIYNEYYRDQNLQNPVPLVKTSGQVLDAELDNIMLIRDRCWEKDYFTSCLPWAQRGGDVSLPVNLTDITYKNKSDVVRSDDGTPLGVLKSDVVTGVLTSAPSAGGTSPDSRIENIVSVDGTSVTVNELRRSVRLQEWLEKNARAGARYIEQILSHFGVVSSDARLQRPEYLGGSSTPMSISEVLSTVQQVNPATGEVVGTPQGDMTGRGLGVGSAAGFDKRMFEEHGFIIGLVSVVPQTAYQQGIPKLFSREDKLDYYWPEFAQLGEQEVKNKELYFEGGLTDTPENTFGYQSRYAEYKFMSSTVHGDFKDNLNFWHMGRIFANQPNLNSNFVTADPTTRIFAVQSNVDQIWLQAYHKVDALRPMPYFNVPSI